MSRLVICTITDLRDRAPDGVTLAFVPEIEGQDVVYATTDAAGRFQVELATDVPYAVGLNGGYRIDGVSLASIGIVRLTVPEGEEPIGLLDCATDILATEWPILHQRLVTLENEVAALKAAIEAVS